MEEKDISIIVMSCDGYSDIWEPFATCWMKFWPKCPYPVYLISENKPFRHDKIQNIMTEKRMSWGEMILFVINKIKTPYLLYLQEDYLLRSPVDEQNLKNYFQIFDKTDAAYLRILPWPGPDEPHPHYPEVGLLKPESKYRTSLQASLWDKSILKSIVDSRDDGRFETWSIERAKDITRPFLCIPRNGINQDINHDGPYPLNYYATSVFQGKWLKEAIRLYENLGIHIDTSHRGVMNRIDFLEYHERKNGTKHLKYRLIKLTQKLLTMLGF